MVQSATDIFVGWGSLGERDFYVRQFRDMKLIPTTDLIAPVLVEFAIACGNTLARAHARSGDPAAIDAYMGKSDVFTKAMRQFARRYADQNERDHAALIAAIRRGKAETVLTDSADDLRSGPLLRRTYLGRNSRVAWLAKSMSGCGHTPKSTVTPVHSAMARAPSAGTGTRSGASVAVVARVASSSQQDLLVECGHRAGRRAGVAQASAAARVAAAAAARPR